MSLAWCCAAPGQGGHSSAYIKPTDLNHPLQSADERLVDLGPLHIQHRKLRNLTGKTKKEEKKLAKNRMTEEEAQVQEEELDEGDDW